MKNLTVQYFARFREQAGCSSENVKTAAPTAADLYNELKVRHGFDLPLNLVRVSINLDFKPADTELREGDAVVFVPPVAGG